MEDSLEILLSNLRYYQSEHGSFEGYIPGTVRKLKKLGYSGPWNLGDRPELIAMTEKIASRIK